MGLFSNRNNSVKKPDHWLDFSSESQLEKIIEASQQKPQVIFKHSTTCGISASAKSRLEQENLSEKVDFHYLDLLSFRSVSNLVAEKLSVVHQSPQVIVINKGQVVNYESHFAINNEFILSNLEA